VKIIERKHPEKTTKNLRICFAVADDENA